MKRIVILFAVFLLLSACSIHHPTYSGYVGSTDFQKYRKLAIIPFADAPNKPSTGLIVQGLACNTFSQLGFHVVERAQLVNILNEQTLSASGLTQTEQIRVGRLLGANAIVVGEVAQYETLVIRGIQPTYNPTTRPRSGGEAFADGFTRGYERAQARDRIENYVSISLRIIDVETGALIYSGSAQFDKGYSNQPQMMADTLLKYIVFGWLNQNHIIEAREKKTKISLTRLKVFDDFDPKINK